MRKIFSFVLMLFALLYNVAPALACEPPPSDTSFDCTDLGSGYKYGFGISGAREGKYYFTSRYGTLVGGAPSDSHNYAEISDSNWYTFDWNASMGIDAVIVITDGQPKVKKLTESTSGENFYGAKNKYGKLYKVKKIYFCYDYELDVDVQAEGTAAGGPASWEITKSVAAAEKSAFAGEKAVFDYTVAVQKVAGGDSSYSLKTVVTVKNNTPLKAKLVWGKVTLNPGKVDLTPSLECGDEPLRVPFYLQPGKSLTCTAVTPLDSRLEGTVTAEVRTSSYVKGDSDSTDIEWTGEAGPAPEGGANEITVTDTNEAFGGPFTVSDSQTWNYAVELSCPSDPAAYTDGKQTTTLDNTATITETGQSASQSVKLLCYAPIVSTTANASVDVQYVWGITKTSPLTELVLQENESADVAYSAVLSITGVNQSNVKLAGSVTVGNPNPGADLTVDLIDEMAPGVPAPLADCASPVTVPAGGSVTCNFEAAAETPAEGSNNVQVVFNGITFPASAPYAPVKNETDECVTVTDTAFTEPLGVVCAGQAPQTFNYTVKIGPFEKCGDTSYLNTAEFVTNDTGATDFSTWELPIDVKCPVQTDCVRTIAYWLKHANSADPTTYNVTWNLVTPNGPATPFYTTGYSWVETLGLNAGTSTYLRLAQAYIAAKLNVLYGATANESVSASITSAESLLEQYATTQNQITGTAATEFKNATTVLSNFNRGVLGSPVCVDCND